MIPRRFIHVKLALNLANSIAWLIHFLNLLFKKIIFDENNIYFGSTKKPHQAAFLHNCEEVRPEDKAGLDHEIGVYRFKTIRKYLLLLMIIFKRFYCF